MTQGLSHITFICRDLDRMEAILIGAPAARKIYDSAGAEFSLSPERFFDIGGVWVAVMEGPPLPARSYNHTAFRIAEADYDARLAAIRALGLDIRESRPRVEGEGEGEGRSIYFHGGNRLFELHTGALAARLARYAKGKG